MRLDRLIPLPTPVRQPSGKDGNPPRREPDTPERDASQDPQAPEGPGPRDGAATPPGHIDITI